MNIITLWLNLFFFVLLLLFIAVQYNDPDGPLWMIIYSIPALWAGIAAFRPTILHRATARVLLVLSLIAALILTLYFWPTKPNWWRQDVWWEQETAREGMGIMIVLVAILVVAWRTVVHKKPSS